MKSALTADQARGAAIAAARAIYYRPERIVDRLVAEFAGRSDASTAAIVRAAYTDPITSAGTGAVFGLRALHWPMLNLLDAADRQRRTFADALAAAVEAARAAAE